MGGVRIRVEDPVEGDSCTGTSQKLIVGLPYTVVGGLDMEVDQKDSLDSESHLPVRRKALPFLQHVGQTLATKIRRASKDFFNHETFSRP
jgi:hypothetical protein